MIEQDIETFFLSRFLEDKILKFNIPNQRSRPSWLYRRDMSLFFKIQERAVTSSFRQSACPGKKNKKIRRESEPEARSRCLQGERGEGRSQREGAAAEMERQIFLLLIVNKWWDLCICLSVFLWLDHKSSSVKSWKFLSFIYNSKCSNILVDQNKTGSV